MIESKLGTVKFTKEKYELCELLHCSKEDIDNTV